MLRNFLFLVSFLSFATCLFAYEVQLLSAVKKDTPIADAEVIFQKSGETSIKTFSNVQGKAFFEGFGGKDDGDVMMLVKKPGFSTFVAKCPCDGLTYALSPNMTNLDGLRIVLTWGKTPHDLDSHLAYPGNHINFQKREGRNANLDVDDTDSYGPETITITKKEVGKRYVYAVNNYSDRMNTDTKRLGNSGARVNVYIGQTLVRTYYAEPNKKGNVWIVLGIDENGAFQDINSYVDIKNSNTQVKQILNEMVASGNFQVSTFSPERIARAKQYNKKGEEEYHKGNLETAMYLFQDAVDSYASYGQAYSNLGLTYQKLNREAEALWANRKAIELASGGNKKTVKASSYYNIAKIYESKGEWQEALTNYESALANKEHSAYRKGIQRMREKLSTR